MEVSLRLEKPSDYRVVEELTREAFWNRHTPGCAEHYLVNVMRGCEAFIGELDYVAEINGLIVGNIMYTKATILGDDGIRREAICFGPLSVLPSYWGKGVGSELIKFTLNRAKEMGYRAVLIYGDPDYYKRFGFAPAEKFGIGSSNNMYMDALQALELWDGALNGCEGRFYEDEVYNVDKTEAKRFDVTFPKKKLRSDLPNQQRFLHLLGLCRQRP